jgi:ABC-2 type transport system permease protein
MLAQVWSITRKELSLWLKKPGQWIVVFIVPLLFIWIFNAVFGGSGGTPTVVVYTVNLDAGKAGETVMNALRGSPNLEIEVLPDRAEADRRVGAGQRMAAVVIPQCFTESVQSSQGGRIELIVDPALSERAAIVTGLVNAAIGPFIIDTEVTRGINQNMGQSLGTIAGQDAETTQKMQKFLAAALKGVASAQVQEAVDNPLVIVDLTPAGKSGDLRPPSLVESLAPGYSLMFVFYLVSMMASTVVEERATGTLRRLLVMPVKRGAILLGKALPFFLIAVLQLTAILGVSRLVFDMRLGSHPGALLVMILATAAAVVGVGMFIAALVRTGGQASGLTMLLVIVMAAVSGSLFPGIRVPFLEYLTPHYWAIQGMQNVMARGMDLSGVLLQVGVLFGVGALFFALGVTRFRFE